MNHSRLGFVLLVATASACAYDWGEFTLTQATDAGANAADGATPSADGSADRDAAGGADGALPDLDAAPDTGADVVIPPVDAGPDVVACTPSVACLNAATPCGSACGATSTSCQQACGGKQSCRNACRNTERSCRTDCANTCVNCTQSAGCSAPSQCDAAAHQ